MPSEFIFTVSEINGYVKKIIDFEDILQNIQVRGEISNFSKSSAGHVYFTLKDEYSSVKCVWFSAEQQSSVLLKDGVRVVVYANASFYVKNGEFQLNVKSVSSAGVGYWFELFNNIKDRLAREGMFDESIKKPLPDRPQRIGVITSEHGAALQDIIKVARRKNAAIEIILFPVTVQGQYAAQEISEALDWFSKNPDVDLLILTRGGGSIEDLWAFNEEIVARNIYRCPVPVISAVGHETDFSISDFAADLRAATPTMAAEIAFTGKQELIGELNALKDALDRGYGAIANSLSWKLNLLRKQIEGFNPLAKVKTDSARLLDMKSKMDDITKYTMNIRAAQLSGQKNLLDSLSPKKVLQRGYSIVTDKSGHVINTVKALNASRILNIIVSDGTVAAIAREENEVEL